VPVAEDISLVAHFERFPATVKGAFVVRAAGRDPHQVAFHEARVVRVPGPGARQIHIEPVTLDVPPRRDLFVPFEFTISDLEPAWYGLEADVDVDGAPRTVGGGKRFCVPWPRSAVRAMSVRVDRRVKVGASTVIVERCQSGTDGATLRFSIDPPQEVAVRLFADDRRLDVVEQEVEPASGRGTLKAYPLLRSHTTLRIEVAGKARGKGSGITVKLP
jgi:hypothetical protein